MKKILLSTLFLIILITFGSCKDDVNIKLEGYGGCTVDKIDGIGIFKLNDKKEHVLHLIDSLDKDEPRFKSTTFEHSDGIKSYWVSYNIYEDKNNVDNNIYQSFELYFDETKLIKIDFDESSYITEAELIYILPKKYNLKKFNFRSVGVDSTESYKNFYYKCLLTNKTNKNVLSVIKTTTFKQGPDSAVYDTYDYSYSIDTTYVNKYFEKVSKMKNKKTEESLNIKSKSL